LLITVKLKTEAERNLKISEKTRHLRLTPVILATQEAEIKRFKVSPSK
jgi:hypothetical protein